MTRVLRVLAVLLVGMAAATCSDNNVSTPLSPVLRPTSFTFATTFTAGGSATRSFEQVQSGTVTLTLSAVTPDVALAVGIGIPRIDGSGCNLTRTVTTRAGSSPQLTITADPGNWCVRVAGAGTVVERVTFALDVKHN
jgi:hypothetical protein